MEEEKILQKVKELISESTFERVDCDLESRVTALEERLEKLKKPIIKKELPSLDFYDLHSNVLFYWFKKEPYYLAKLRSIDSDKYYPGYNVEYMIKHVNRDYYIKIEGEEYRVEVSDFHAGFGPADYEKFLKEIE